MCLTRQATYHREILLNILALLPGASYRMDLSNAPTTIAKYDQNNADQLPQCCCFKALLPTRRKFSSAFFFCELISLLPRLLTSLLIHLRVALPSATAACPPFVTHLVQPMSISIPLPTGPELGGFGKLLHTKEYFRVYNDVLRGVPFLGCYISLTLQI
jgi:hypothetical protein